MEGRPERVRDYERTGGTCQDSAYFPSLNPIALVRDGDAEGAMVAESNRLADQRTQLGEAGKDRDGQIRGPLWVSVEHFPLFILANLCIMIWGLLIP